LTADGGAGLAKRDEAEHISSSKAIGERKRSIERRLFEMRTISRDEGI
jgi:hypothetical protein